MGRKIEVNAMGNELKKPYSDVIARRRKAAADALALLGTAPALPSPGDICELSVVCAVHDLGYRLRFVRQASGLFRFSESIKKEYWDDDDVAYGNPSPVGSVSLPIDEFEPGPTPCAWCGNNSYNYCICGSLVCRGRTIGQLFRCRDSCGAEWVGTPLTQVSGIMPRSEPMHFQAPPARTRPALTFGPRRHQGSLSAGINRLALPGSTPRRNGGSER